MQAARRVSGLISGPEAKPSLAKQQVDADNLTSTLALSWGS
jgi:hypothetical protein